MSLLPRFLLVVLACLAGVLPALAQTPRVYFKFDGNLTDSSGAGIVTTVTPSWTVVAGDYATDRNGVASRALTFSGSRGLQLLASSLPNNSSQALGLRNAGGTNTPFTLTAWVYFTSLGSGQGYSTVFGNTGTGTGTLHAGLGSGSAKTHLGFEANDLNAGTVDLVANVWYHVAFVYDTAAQTSGSAATPCQRIYINGVPEATRYGVTNTLKAADVLLGNWNTTTDGSNDMKGRLDDVAVYNTALKADQIQALFNGVAPTALPAAGTYSAPKLPGVFGTPANWGIREIKATTPSTTVNGISYGTLVNADRIIRSNPTTAQATIAEYQASVINFLDDENPMTATYFANDGDFRTDTPADDNNLLMMARCAIRIPAGQGGDYSFGFRGDDGSRLRVLGKQFASSTRLNTGNPADPAHNGDGICFTAGTGDSNTLGVVNLAPGDYNIEFTWWEGGGGAGVEVYAAKGAKTSVDSAFQLIGNTAAGGLEIVRDPDTVPTLTANGGGTVFVHSGSPANFTLAWSVANPTTALSIDQGIGAVAQSGSSVITSPASTRTYTITATTPVGGGGSDVATKAVTVYVNSPPVITSLTADKPAVTSGTAVTLSWAVDGAASLTLQPGNISVTGQTSRVVNPTSTTTYTLEATNPSGTSQQQFTVNVGIAPTINSFAAADANPLFGAETSLNWNVSSSNSVSINQGAGPISGATGSVSIVPIQTTTYTLTATNEYGSSTATATVNQAAPIGVTSAGFTVQRVNAITPFPFTGMTYLQSADALLGGLNQSGSVTTVTGVTTINYSDGADGDFTTGNSAFPGGTGNGVNFAVKITGTFIVNTPGEYTFVLNSDDGARLRIDGQDVIVDDATHSPSANSGRVTLTKATAQIELVYYNAPTNGGSAGAELELAWIRPNQTFQLLGVVTPSAPVVRGQVIISEFMASNSGTILDEQGISSDWIEIWNSTTSTVDLSGYYLTNSATNSTKWAFPNWTLAPNEYLVVFASGRTDAQPAQAVPGVDNPGTLAQPRLHTNFKLAAAGEYLGLKKSDGVGGYTTLTAFSPVFPPQKTDVTYGSSDSEGYIGYMSTPTPGGLNAATVVDFVKDTKFVDAADGVTQRKRGRYTTPFNLAISTTTSGATIRYTTDGSPPTVNSGTVYTGPIAINKTTILRTSAFKTGWMPTNVDTATYLFIDDVVNQTSTTSVASGFPSGAVNGQVFRYGFNLANVTSAGGTLQSLKDALSAAPTVSMVTDMANLTNASTGIYVNPSKHGLAWERPCSIEYINAAGTSEFQLNCGVRIRGGASRSATNPKHAFHLFFRNSLYDGKLNYRLFGLAGASEFSQIDMRCEQNYSWSKDNSNQNTLMREEWSRQTQADMGQPYARNGYFHLYVNGVYWGVFDWEERTEAAFGETYLGGGKDNTDAVKSAGSSGGYNTEMTDGNFIAWKSLWDQCVALKADVTESGRTAKFMQMRGFNANGTPNASYPVLLDVDNLIDYLLVICYDGSFDAPMSTFLQNASNNWFGVRDRLGSRGFAFFTHDNEHGMDSQSATLNNSYNRVGPWGGSGANNWGQTMYNTVGSFAKSNPHYLHELLCFSSEYRQRFADRAQKHLFNNGALTTAAALGRVEFLGAQVDPIIHAEAARWGSTTLNRNTWLNTAKATVVSFINNGGVYPSGSTQTNFGAQARTSMVIQQLRGYQDPVGTAKALFTPATLSAPIYSGQFGGSVSSPYAFQITNPNAGGTIYYSLDGSDPRATGGGIAAGALTGASPVAVNLNSTATVRARIFNGTDWSPLVDANYVVGPQASASNLVISKIHYNPPGSGDATQFVELMNISGITIDLTNVQFTIGIQFQFPNAYTMAPGARVLIVRDLVAFQSAYPAVPPSQIAGIFANGTTLATNGEQLILVDFNGATIRSFSYNNKSPWPESPDGFGPCLVLLRPETNPDHSLAANWRPSAAGGGSPGETDALGFTAWSGTFALTGGMTGDDDNDGTSNLGEYFLGTHPLNPASTGRPVQSVQTVSVGGVVGSYLTLTFTRAIGRDDASAIVEAVSDLASPAWVAASMVGVPLNNGNGTETITYRHPDPMPSPPTGGTRQFLRLRITQP